VLRKVAEHVLVDGSISYNELFASELPYKIVSMVTEDLIEAREVFSLTLKMLSNIVAAGQLLSLTVLSLELIDTLMLALQVGDMNVSS
jgi:hypothetical protein